MAKVKFKLKLTKNHLIALAIISVIVFSIAYYEFFVPKPIMSWKFGETELYFRADLREADNVPVYPGESQLYLDTMHTLVRNVTIMYKPTDDLGYYATEAFEITYKMKLAYLDMAESYALNSSRVPGFDVQEIDDYANLPGKIQNPVIALVSPEYANETAIRNDGHVTYISGETYDDLDLAVTKFLMVVLGIDLEES